MRLCVVVIESTNGSWSSVTLTSHDMLHHQSAADSTQDTQSVTTHKSPPRSPQAATGLLPQAQVRLSDAPTRPAAPTRDKSTHDTVQRRTAKHPPPLPRSAEL